MKYVVIIRENRESGKLVADVYDDFYHGDVNVYRDIYDNDTSHVVSINFVEHVEFSLS